MQGNATGTEASSSESEVHGGASVFTDRVADQSKCYINTACCSSDTDPNDNHPNPTCGSTSHDGTYSPTDLDSNASGMPRSVSCQKDISSHSLPTNNGELYNSDLNDSSVASCLGDNQGTTFEYGMLHRPPKLMKLMDII